VQAFFPAADAMRRFRKERGPVVLLSNAPRLGDGVEGPLRPACTFRATSTTALSPPAWPRAPISSLRTQGDKPLRLFYLGPPRDNPIFRGLNIVFASPEDADVVFCTGLFDDDNEGPEDYRGILERFKARGLPFLCANPDIVVQRGDKLIYCAGAIARLYETLGGEVVYYGKPYPAVFERAIEQARAVGSASRPLVIGDGIET
jgi:HAD superfamily hydrolase (TIGR01459 family)